MKKVFISLFLTMGLTGCVSPSYCKGVSVDPDHSNVKCAAAVSADVVLVPLYGFIKFAEAYEKSGAGEMRRQELQRQQDSFNEMVESQNRQNEIRQAIRDELRDY